MTPPSVTELLTELLTTRYDVEPQDITPDAVLEDMSLDSLALMEISLALEKRLGVPVAEGTLTAQQTVSQASTALTALRAA